MNTTLHNTSSDLQMIEDCFNDLGDYGNDLAKIVKEINNGNDEHLKLNSLKVYTTVLVKLAESLDRFDVLERLEFAGFIYGNGK